MDHDTARDRGPHHGAEDDGEAGRPAADSAEAGAAYTIEIASGSVVGASESYLFSPQGDGPRAAVVGFDLTADSIDRLL